MRSHLLRSCPFLLVFASLLQGEDFWSAFEAWESPDEQSWVVTGTFGDSDEDAVFALQRAWRRHLGESAWLLGWEVGGGVAQSGKYERTGALATLDFILKRDLFALGGLEVGLNGAFGLQLQSIRFPGGSYHNGRIGSYLDFAWGREGGRTWEVRLGYLHISNANLGSGNEGHDAIWVGGGWRW